MTFLPKHYVNTGAVVLTDFGLTPADASRDLHDLGSLLYFAVEGIESVPPRALAATIRHIHAGCDGTYGAPRATPEGPLHVR